MVKIKDIVLSLLFIISISGCVTSSKVVQPEPEGPDLVLEEHVPIGNFIAEPSLERPIITYSQITNLIGEFLEIQSLKDSSGETKFSGVSDDKLVRLEMIGEKDNIGQASIELAYLKDIEPINKDLNKAMMLRFLRNAAPEFEKWPSSVEDIISRFDSMDKNTTEEDRIALDKKIIDILYDKRIPSSIRLTVFFHPNFLPTK